ncbi:hypothetical protein ACFQUU_18020 [Herbaspirillum sp. GCM10030257]|uniref:hypothetical protein n=1 Tax=Herbaspirillum sp. GCM10030257 TaxID=3273393 RepID=UPI0036093905
MFRNKPVPKPPPNNTSSTISTSNAASGNSVLAGSSSNNQPPIKHPGETSNTVTKDLKRRVQRLSQLASRKQPNLAKDDFLATTPGTVGIMTQTKANPIASVSVKAHPQQRIRSQSLGGATVNAGSARKPPHELQRMNSMGSNASNRARRLAGGADPAEAELRALRMKGFYVERVDRDGLVRMKWRGKDFANDTCLGVADTNYKIASRKYAKHVDDPPVPDNCKLVKRGEDGQWSVTNADETPTDLADGNYIFVTMANGTIRIGDSRDGQNAHCLLSNHAAYVKYAGTIRFHEGKPVEGSSQSGTYLPDPGEWENSGFDKTILKNPEDLDFEHIKELYEKGRQQSTPSSSEADLPIS